MKSSLPLALVALVMTSYWPQFVSGHGRLWTPPGRATMFRRGYNTPRDYNDNQLFCGGFQHEVAQGYKCGLCGDPYDGDRPNEAGGPFATGILTGNYTQGAEIVLEVDLTANHKGWFEFKVCPVSDPADPKVKATQECLDRFPLQLSDGSGTKLPVAKYGSAMVSIPVTLPQDLTCDFCMLQWRYHGGNNWGTNPDGTSCVGCGYQEEFYGCADIRIKPKDQSNPTTSNAPPSSPRPSPKARSTSSPSAHQDETTAVDHVTNHVTNSGISSSSPAQKKSEKPSTLKQIILKSTPRSHHQQKQDVFETTSKSQPKTDVFKTTPEAHTEVDVLKTIIRQPPQPESNFSDTTPEAQPETDAFKTATTTLKLKTEVFKTTISSPKQPNAFSNETTPEPENPQNDSSNQIKEDFFETTPKTKSQTEVFKATTRAANKTHFMHPNIDRPTVFQPTLGLKCKAVRKDPGLTQWCYINCRRDFCPKTHCLCKMVPLPPKQPNAFSNETTPEPENPKNDSKEDFFETTPKTKSQTEVFKTTTGAANKTHFVPPHLDRPTAFQPLLGLKCKAVMAVPGLTDWCYINCRSGFCPKTHCLCKMVPLP